MYFLPSFLEVADLPFFLQIFVIFEALISNSIAAVLIEIYIFFLPFSTIVEIIGLLILFSIFCL